MTCNGSTNLPLHAGSYSITGTLNDVMYSGSCTGLFTVAKAAQEITAFNAPASAIWTQSFVLAATGGDSTNPIMFSATAPGSLSDNSLTFTGVGDAVLVASQGGDSNYLVAPDRVVTTTVMRAPQLPLVFAPSTGMVFHSTNTLTLAGGSGTGAVSFAVLDGPGVLTESNLFVTSGSGTIRLEAEKAQDALYEASAITATIYCVKAAQHITQFIPSSGTVYQYTTNYLSAQSDADGVSVCFAAAAASVSNRWLSATSIYYVATGQVYLVASQSGNSNYLAASSITNLMNVVKYVPPIVTNPVVVQTNIAVDGCSLYWSVSEPTVTGFCLDVSTDGVFSPGYYLAGYSNYIQASSSITLSGLSNTNAYYFRVKALNGSGSNLYSVTESIHLAVWLQTVATPEDAGWLSPAGSNLYYYGNTVALQAAVTNDVYRSFVWTLQRGSGVLSNAAAADAHIALFGDVVLDLLFQREPHSLSPLYLLLLGP